MLKKDKVIYIDGVVYKSSHDAEDDCRECAFLNETSGCRSANEFYSCADMQIIWKPYSKAVNKESPLNTQNPEDGIVAEIRELLLQRSQTGIAKYGTTLDRKDLKPSEWCQHLLEELLDASGYVLRLKKDLEAIEKITKGTA
jgi:hypothetical protein